MQRTNRAPDSLISKGTHTTQNGQNKWTNILTLEITTFGLKMVVKSGLEFSILKLNEPLQRYLLTGQTNSAFLGNFFLELGSTNYEGACSILKQKKSRPLCTIIFKPKMVITRAEILVQLQNEFQVV